MNRIINTSLSLVFCLVSSFLIAEEYHEGSKEKLHHVVKGFEPYNTSGNKLSSKDMKYLKIAYWKDRSTGLFWTNGTTTVSKNGTLVYRTWSEAELYCSHIKYGEKTNWRLATKEELEQLIDSGVYKLNNFPGIGNLYSWFWSSSEVLQDNDYIWLVFIKSGVSSYIPKVSESYGVLCVHD